MRYSVLRSMHNSIPWNFNGLKRMSGGSFSGKNELCEYATAEHVGEKACTCIEVVKLVYISSCVCH